VISSQSTLAARQSRMHVDSLALIISRFTLRAWRCSQLSWLHFAVLQSRKRVGSLALIISRFALRAWHCFAAIVIAFRRSPITQACWLTCAHYIIVRTLHLTVLRSYLDCLLSFVNHASESFIQLCWFACTRYVVISL
jgi:hypothetical protein